MPQAMMRTMTEEEATQVDSALDALVRLVEARRAELLQHVATRAALETKDMEESEAEDAARWRAIVATLRVAEDARQRAASHRTTTTGDSGVEDGTSRLERLETKATDKQAAEADTVAEVAAEPDAVEADAAEHWQLAMEAGERLDVLVEEAPRAHIPFAANVRLVVDEAAIDDMFAKGVQLLYE